MLRLGFRFNNSEHKSDPKKIIFNYSSRRLTQEETDALSHGLKFGLPPKKLQYCKFFLPFEKLFGDLKGNPIHNNDSGNGLNRVLTSIKQLAMETFYSYSPVDSESHHNVLQALKPISQDPSIVVTKPDKGNGVVILNKSDYHAKMDGILSD